MYMVSGTPAATMRTRRESYPSPSDGITYTIRPQQKKRRLEGGEFGGRPWKLTFPSTKRLSCSGFDNLPEDLLIIILSSLSSTASSPADLVNAMLVYVPSDFFTKGCLTSPTIYYVFSVSHCCSSPIWLRVHSVANIVRTHAVIHAVIYAEVAFFSG
jgi:hypothetical protein